MLVGSFLGYGCKFRKNIGIIQIIKCFFLHILRAVPEKRRAAPGKTNNQTE